MLQCPGLNAHIEDDVDTQRVMSTGYTTTDSVCPENVFRTQFAGFSSIQDEISSQAIEEDVTSWRLPDAGSEGAALQLVGGVDISFTKEPQRSDGVERAVAGLVVLSYPDLQQQYADFERVHMNVPYVAGYLAFRECPAYLTLLARAAQTAYMPQVVLVDGCGVLHPRGCGSATQLGVLADIPTVGVAKSLLHVDGLNEKEFLCRLYQEDAACQATCHPVVEVPVSSFQGQQCLESRPHSLDSSRHYRATQPDPAHQDRTEVTQLHGLWAVATAESPQGGNGSREHILNCRGPATRIPLVGASGRVLGMAVRASAGVKRPVYVSVGHRVSLQTAAELTVRCSRHRVPEPIRLADIQTRQQLQLWLTSLGIVG